MFLAVPLSILVTVSTSFMIRALLTDVETNGMSGKISRVVVAFLISLAYLRVLRAPTGVRRIVRAGEQKKSN